VDNFELEIVLWLWSECWPSLGGVCDDGWGLRRVLLWCGTLSRMSKAISPVHWEHGHRSGV
jgi:hypothetical protein